MEREISYDKIHQDYIKLKGEYPFEGSTDHFDEEEIQLIKNLKKWSKID